MKRIALMTAVLALGAHAGLAQAGGSVEAGKQKAQQCAACHGEAGNSTNPQFPVIAGQYESYLLHTLKAYKSGARENAIMQGQVAGLSEQDLADLAAYFAAQDGLHVPGHDPASK